jgi:hypothetical protein
MKEDVQMAGATVEKIDITKFEGLADKLSAGVIKKYLSAALAQKDLHLFKKFGMKVFCVELKGMKGYVIGSLAANGFHAGYASKWGAEAVQYGNVYCEKIC